MSNLSPEIQDRLNKLAYKLSIPFCYSCYQEVPSGICPRCLSDDCMRLLPGVACEYGSSWIIEHLIRDNLTPINIEEAFQESVSQCYPETTTVGFLELDTVQTMKESDPIAWDLSQSEWLDNEETEGQIVTFNNGGAYYYTHDVERYVERAEADLDQSAANTVLGCS